MDSILSAISRSIKEKKWLQIEYYNKHEDKCKYFWICILDIDPIKRKCKIKLFNQEYSLDVKDGWIYIEQIRQADVLEGTTYAVPQALLTKLHQHHKAFDFLEYTGVNERILDYYQKCYQQDRDATVKDYELITGIDTDILLGKVYPLQEKQYKEFIKKLKLNQKLKKQKFQQKIIKFAINVLSLKNNNGICPIIFRDILLDIEKKVILASNDNCYNVKLDNREQGKGMFQLSTYFDGELSDFIESFEHDKENCLRQINANSFRHEMLDDHPYIFQLEQHILINIEQEYQTINAQYISSTLSAPLKCFFGLTEKDRKRKPRSILCTDNETNIDQLRSQFNAMTRNVVYVQGPPGTGKTRTIINVILSCLLNDFTALIVSNNNEAIHNIYRKLTTFTWHNTIFSLPVLRLGSNESIKDSLQQLHDHLQSFTSLQGLKEIRLRIKFLKDQLIQSSKNVEKMLETFEDQTEIMEQMDSLKQLILDIEKETQVDEVSKSMTIHGIKAQMQNLADNLAKETDNKHAVSHINKEILMEYLYLCSKEHLYRLKSPKHENLYRILLLDDEKERLRCFRNYLEEQKNMRLLLDVFPFIISTNISVTKLAEPIPTFDLMIMDEASQCNTALALLPMARCKRALFVGDQNQLQPVILLNHTKNAQLMQSYDIPAAYSYRDNSILSTLLKVDTLSKFILLREHFRCNDKIIQFANQKYYDNELKLCSRLHNVDALKLIDVNSQPTSQKNTSISEVDALLKELQHNKHKEIAVITPFRKQAEYIERTLMEHNLQHIKVGTIHTFQGDEKDRIILCSGIASNAQQGSFNWIKNNQQLLNVATTRAKENLTLICDVQKIKELSRDAPNDFLELVDYIKNDGNYTVAYRENEVFSNKVKNFKYYNTQTEEQLLRTLLHIKSVYRQIIIKNKVPVNDILQNDEQDHLLFGKGKENLFDFVVYDLAKHPLAVVEIIGCDHYNPEKMQQYYQRKEEICMRNHIKLITIGNDYIRRYSYIKQAILTAITE